MTEIQSVLFVIAGIFVTIGLFFAALYVWAISLDSAYSTPAEREASERDIDSERRRLDTELRVAKADPEFQAMLAKLRGPALAQCDCVYILACWCDVDRPCPPCASSRNQPHVCATDEERRQFAFEPDEQ